MELKAPRPLGEGKINDVTQKVTQIQNRNKESRKQFKLPKINIPTLAIPEIEIPNIEVKKRRNIIEISLILIPLLLLIILFLSISIYVRSEPFRISQTFIEKIKEKDITTAYSMTTDAYKAIVSEKEFLKITEPLNKLDLINIKQKNKKIEKVYGMGEYAYVRYIASGYNIDITLFNDQTDWGIHSVKLSVIENN